MLQPPVSTPTERMMPMERSRRCWYSRSVSVIAGATVIESPVCTPIGSRFSIEHTITTLSSVSRMTSSSYSFQPMIDSSRSTSVVGLAASPAPAIRRRSSSSYAIPEPVPPMVKLGRTTIGQPRSWEASKQSWRVWHTAERATLPPSSSTIFLNDSRFSPRLIASMLAPISSTPYFSRTPSRSRSIAAFSAVWPPRVASSASGRSFSITFSTNSAVIGSTYVASANSGSVMIVAGLELTRITRSPSALSTRQAWVPE